MEMSMEMHLEDSDERPMTCKVCGDDLLPCDEGGLCAFHAAEQDAANRDDGDDLEDWPARPRGV